MAFATSQDIESGLSGTLHMTHWKLALMATVITPFSWWLVKRTGRTVGYYGVVQNNAMAEANAAAIEALGALKQESEVDLYTDSQYLRHGITEWIEQWKQRGWKTASRKPVKNADLWQRLDELRARHDVHWAWVRGHSGDEGNEMADRLANEAIDELLDAQQVRERH